MLLPFLNPQDRRTGHTSWRCPHVRRQRARSESARRRRNSNRFFRADLLRWALQQPPRHDPVSPMCPAGSPRADFDLSFRFLLILKTCAAVGSEDTAGIDAGTEVIRSKRIGT